MTAKELAALWEPLAAREPGLRPGGLSFYDSADPYWHFEGEQIEVEDPYVGHRISPALAAAIWRDAAVRWLAREAERRSGSLNIWIADGGHYVSIDAPDGGTEHGCDSPDLDRQLAAAVRAVPDAKPAPQEVS